MGCTAGPSGVRRPPWEVLPSRRPIAAAPCRLRRRPWTRHTYVHPAHVRPRPERRALHNEPRLDDPSCSGPVPTAKTTLNPAHVRPERRALHNEPRLDDPSCSGPVPTAKTTLNPAHVRPRPERRALHNEPRLDDTIVQRPRADCEDDPEPGTRTSTSRKKGLAQ